MSGGAAADRYLAELSKSIDQGYLLQVGFLEGATYPDGTSVAMIAAVQNWGSPSRGIPPRPFFTNAVRDGSTHWGSDFVAILDAAGGDVELALNRMGELIAGEIRQSIVDTNEPPNSPVTNLLKQRFPMGGQTFADVLKARADVAAGETAPAGKPLVQQGIMLNAVDYRVTKGGNPP